MDELLELMNNDNSNSTLIVDTDRDNDSDTEGEQQQKKDPVTPSVSHNKKDRVGRGRSKAGPKRKQDRSSISAQSSSNRRQGTHLAEASVDDRLGIRMINRLVPSTDMSELIMDYNYFSPSILSTMTLKRLNSLLQDPSPIIDPATVSGKTDSLVTVGIVFSNCGTRISSKGGAFCVLTIGSNLNSGPCLTIFLFGEAYGKFCVSCKPGKVIALMSPKLLPASRGESTGSSTGYNADCRVSFSVYDAGQLKIVANARDYGACKASACKAYVDKNKSDYCEYHRRERQQKSKGGGKIIKRFQQVKAIHQQANSILVASATRKKNLMSTSSRKFNKFLAQTSSTNNHSKKTVAKSTTMASANNPTSLLRVNEPVDMFKKMKKTLLPHRKSSKGNLVSTGNPDIKTLLAKRETAIVGDNDISTKGTKRSTNPCLGEDWLEKATVISKKRGPAHIGGRKGFSLSHFTNTHTKKPRMVNTNGIKTDGSVLIPKPSKLFHQSSAPKEVAPKRIITPTAESKQRRKLLQRQAEVAHQINGDVARCEGKGIGSILSDSRVRALPSKRSSKGRTSKKSKDVDSFLAAMGGEIDEEKIRTARSQFADEVEADEYARHRRKVVELEKLEASQELRNKKVNSDKGNSKLMTKIYFCQNCRQNYKMKPKSCYAAHHRVKEKFDLKKITTKDERRGELHRKSSEDGGLHLGSGIAWTILGR